MRPGEPNLDERKLADAIGLDRSKCIMCDKKFAPSEMIDQICRTCLETETPCDPCAKCGKVPESGMLGRGGLCDACEGTVPVEKVFCTGFNLDAMIFPPLQG